MSSVRDSLPPGDALESTFAGADAGASQKGRVLLLEDDPLFKEGIADFLTENGYAVVVVDNGSDGVREVLEGEFAMILCDMRMPKVSGEVFFRAVERIRPELCGRFVFMTGYSGDDETTDFIERVSGFLLRKPFRFEELLDWIEVTSVCGGRGNLTEGASSKPVPPQVCPRSDALPGGGTPAPHSESLPRIPACTQPDWAPAGIPSPVWNGTAPLETAGVFAAIEPEDRPARGSGWGVLTGLGLVLLLGAVLWNRYWDARDNATAAAAERLAHEAGWAALSQDLEKAVAVRSKIERDENQSARISADRAKPRWTPALRGILTVPGTGIELLEVRARGRQEDPGSSEVRVHGMARGAEPRLHADRFRQAVEDKLKGIASGRLVTTRFERLDDVPGAHPDQKQADFVMIVTLGSMEHPAAGGKEGR